MVQERFLLQFNQWGWSTIFCGLAGEIWASGPQGGISLYAVYFATGNAGKEEEISAKQSRERTRRAVASSIPPESKRVSMVLGEDFNWVASDLGRLSTDKNQPSGGRDQAEEAQWKELNKNQRAGPLAARGFHAPRPRCPLNAG